MLSRMKYRVKKLFFKIICLRISIEDILPDLFQWLNSHSSSTFTYNRVVNHKDGFIQKQLVGNEYKYTVIVQGPIHHSKYLTLNVLNDFLSSHEESQIILSTWQEENTLYIETHLMAFIATKRLRIIKSSKPAYSGISNINLQISSVKNAFEFLGDEQTQYVLKVRSDQRFLNPNVCTTLEEYFNRYSDETSLHKILITSLNTFVYRNFGASDFLQFGLFQDIKDFWGLELDSRRESDLKYPKPKNMKEESENSVCEVFLTRNYLAKIGYLFEDNLLGSLKAFADVFIVVDADQIGLIWTKYGFVANGRGFLPENSPFLELTQNRWLQLTSNGLEGFNHPEVQGIPNRSF